MNKTELVARISSTSGISQKQAKEMVDTVFASLVDALQDSKRVSIRGLGAFEVREHKEKVCRNPFTGDMVVLPKRPALVFTASRSLRRSLELPDHE